MNENKISLGTVQNTINLLAKRTNDNVSYKTLTAYLKNNYESLVKDQIIFEDNNPLIAEINNTKTSLDTLLSPLNNQKKEDSSLIPSNKNIFAIKQLNQIKIELHDHDCIEIDYIVKGQATLIFENKQVLLKEGMVCFISPTSKHDIEIGNDDFVINIFVRNKVLQGILNNQEEEFDLISKFVYNILFSKDLTTNYLLFEAKENQTLLNCVKNIISESYSTSDKYSSKVTLSWLNIFICSLLRNFHNFSLYAPLDDLQQHAYQILSYIEKNYTTVSLSSLAAHFHYNSSYLSNFIKENIGLSFSQIITNIRMENAKIYLTTTNLSIADIAGGLGYGSVDHFSRTFKKFNNITPSKYRKKILSMS
ncbi:AraC family transcriptional regulator [Candidatus Enterococcus huntleyi]|uniref:AraC family transcriptional regulator n=1 Tax=Candidatus Enterococcus huntleyi TaxID=1857217 RepID=UPI00137B4636|nr:AraC family transcriptional regulator [Enterococcus sp. JM4C]